MWCPLPGDLLVHGAHTLVRLLVLRPRPRVEAVLLMLLVLVLMLTVLMVLMILLTLYRKVLVVDRLIWPHCRGLDILLILII